MRNYANDASASKNENRLYLCAVIAGWLLSAIAFVALSFGENVHAVTPSADTVADRPSLTIKPGREFSAESYVHQALSAQTVRDARSELWVADIQRQIRGNYGVATVNIDRYSPPLFVVPKDQPTVRVLAARAEDPRWNFAPLQQQWLDVPFPNNFEASAGMDKEAIIYQPSTGRYWEFWGAEKTGKKISDSAGRKVEEWRAAWGGKIDEIRNNPGYFPTTSQGYKFGVTATSLTLLAGLITIDEQRRGEINHALHFSLPETQANVWRAPAQRTDGQKRDPNAIPQGATFRLPAALAIEAMEMDPYAKMLARAVQKFGMIVRDTSGAVAFYAENPLSHGKSHPYFGVDGILRCAKGNAESSCYLALNCL